MSLDLKNTINNTNLEKEKLKRAKANIDTKLVAVGGNRAIDLADVPNRIQAVRDNLIKYAHGSLSWKIYSFSYSQEGRHVINIPLGLAFKPKRLILEIQAKNAAQAPLLNRIDAFKGGYVNLKDIKNVIEMLPIKEGDFQADGSVNAIIYSSRANVDFWVENFEAFEK